MRIVTIINHSIKGYDDFCASTHVYLVVSLASLFIWCIRGKYGTRSIVWHTRLIASVSSSNTLDSPFAVRRCTPHLCRCRGCSPCLLWRLPANLASDTPHALPHPTNTQHTRSSQRNSSPFPPTSLAGALPRWDPPPYWDPTPLGPSPAGTLPCWDPTPLGPSPAGTLPRWAPPPPGHSPAGTLPHWDLPHRTLPRWDPPPLGPSPAGPLSHLPRHAPAPRSSCRSRWLAGRGWWSCYRRAAPFPCRPLAAPPAHSL